MIADKIFKYEIIKYLNFEIEENINFDLETYGLKNLKFSIEFNEKNMNYKGKLIDNGYQGGSRKYCSLLKDYYYDNNFISIDHDLYLELLQGEGVVNQKSYDRVIRKALAVIEEGLSVIAFDSNNIVEYYEDSLRQF